MKIISFIFTFFFCLGLSAQNQWDNIITPSAINEILEIEGLYYCATDAGLMVYNPDNETFTRSNISDGLPSQVVEDITIDDQGSIWIGTYDNGIGVMTDEGWERIPAPESIENVTLIYCIEFDDEGTLWVGTNAGVFKYINEEWFETEILKCWDIEKDENGKMYFSGPFPTTVENGVITYYYVPLDELTYIDASCIEYGENNRIYWGRNRGGITIMDNTNTDEWTFYSSEYLGAEPTSNLYNFCTDLELMDNGDLWAILKEGQLFKFDGTDWTLIHQFETNSWSQLDKNTEGDLLIGVENKLYSLGNLDNEIADFSNQLPSNELEIMSNEYGQILVKCENRLFRYDGFDMDNIELPPLADKTDYTGLEFVKFPDETVGFFEKTTGNIYHQNEIIEVYNPLDFYEEEVLGTLYVQEVFIDQEGGIWAATNNVLIYHNNGENTLFDYSNLPFEQNPGVPSLIIFDMAEDRNGDVWVSQPKGIGIWRRNTQVWDFIDREEVDFITMSVNNDIYFDEENVLWAGGNNGLIRFDGETWSDYKMDNSDISANRVSEIYPWNDQLIIGARGLDFFDGENFENLQPSNSGLGSILSKTVETDAQGNLWVAHSTFGFWGYGGISVYNPEGISLGASTLFNEQNTIDFSVYPNPSNDFIQVDLKTVEQSLEQIQLMDLTGKVVFSQNLQTDNQVEILKIPLSNLHKGLYVLNLNSPHHSHSTKIIVQ